MTIEQRNQWAGSESTPITFTPVRPHNQRVTTGYDEQLDDDTLYPTRQPSSTKRYQQNTDVPPPAAQRTVTRTSQQQVRQPNRYDSVNVYVRRRSSQGPTSRQSQTTTQRQTTTQQQAPRPVRQPEPEPDDDEPETERLPRHHVRKTRFHWLVYLGVGMVAMLILWLVGTIALNWWQSSQDDLRYGHPRTYQCDARVGHNDAQTSSHFIALNLNHRVEVIEFPGGDATKAKVYLGPLLTGQDSDQDIVTVSFKDVNGDGKPDLILSVENAKYVYINDNGTFRPPNANEHINM